MYEIIMNTFYIVVSKCQKNPWQQAAAEHANNWVVCICIRDEMEQFSIV